MTLNSFGVRVYFIYLLLRANKHLQYVQLFAFYGHIVFLPENIGVLIKLYGFEEIISNKPHSAYAIPTPLLVKE